MKIIPIFLAVLLVMIETAECSMSPQFVYQEDMSEYCQRRVISSVFLGQRVVKANSQILHFTAMEVPYTCAISIRAEPGSNIVFVIEMNNITDTCHTSVPDVSQVMVYELGETFGGYWGLLPPEFLTSSASTKGKYHTIHTTTIKEIPAESGDSNSDNGYLDKPIIDVPYEELVEETTHQDQKGGSEVQSFITVEVPLVNVSGVLVDSDSANTKQENTSDDDDTFDILYDVAPKPGEEYSTTILPLVQFSMYQEPYRRRFGNITNEEIYKTDNDRRIDGGTDVSNETEAEGSRYALDYEIFTPDPRLKYQFLGNILLGKKGKINKKQKSNANKILKFRHQTPWFRARSSLKQYPDHALEMRTEKPFPTVKIGNDSADNPSKYIDELMAALRSSKGQEQLERDDNLKSSKLLRKIADMNHNFSAYLVQNESVYNVLPTSAHFRELESKVTHFPNASMTLPVTKHNSDASNLFHEPKALVYPTKQMQETNHKQYMLSLRNTNMTGQHFNKSTLFRSSETKKHKVIQTKATESYLNLTNSNVTQTSTKTTPISSTNVNDKISKVINYNRKDSNDEEMKTSHKSSTKASSTEPETTTKYTISKKPSESGHTQLVDHESWENIVQAAPALAGVLNKNNPVETEVKKKQVNRLKRRGKRFIQAIDIEVAQPRIVTMRSTTRTAPADMFHFADKQDLAQLVELEDDDVKRMTIVVTPARTLSTQDARCPDLHLECQVLGARVCIDRSVACDGVPNCGTYDIYDEDRLMCSTDNGVKHNVYMAAIAFLAVLLTALYTVHYWLRRCVPRVSDAFFVYTDGTENILYLDTIMRSPTADHGDDEPLLHDHYSMAGMMTDMLSEGSGHKKYLWTKLKNLFRHFGKKHQEKALDISLDKLDLNLDILDLESSRRQHMYSFTECEINTIAPQMLDETTQTGDSLEMKFLKGETESKRDGNLEANKLKKQDRQRTREMERILQLKDASISIVDKDKSKDSELSMLKFMKGNRTAGRRGTNLPDIPEDVNPRLKLSRSVGVGEEKEIQTTIYDTEFQSKLTRDSLSSDVPIASSSSYFDTLKPSSSKQARKQLRFNDNITTISSSDVEVDDEITKQRQNTLAETAKNYDNLEEYREHSAARDFKRFWSTNKGSKKETPKKKNKSTFR